MKHTSRLLLAAATLVAASTASADTLGSSIFNSNTPGTNLTGVTAAGSDTINWGEAGNGGLDIVNDATFGANALVANATGTFYAITGTLGSTKTLALGETITLSFDGRFLAAPLNGGGAFRFGFTNTTLDPDNAFGVNLGTGTSTTLNLFRDAGGDDSALGGALTNLTAAPTYAGITTTGAFSASFSITKVASGYDISTTIDADGAGAGLAETFTANSATGWDDFNAVVIRNGNYNQDFAIDNVTVTAVPEPSTYGLMGAGALAAVAMVRRRRKHAGLAQVA